MNDTPQNRRGFLRLCTDSLIAAITLLVGLPAVAYVLAPLRRRKGEKKQSEADFVDMGPLQDLKSATWVLLPFDVVREDGWEEVRQRHSIYVRRHGDSESDVTVLSPICTHLGCPINWSIERNQFLCPCHGGTFDAEGKHIAGPPPRSMDPLPFQIRDGHLFVQWEDFKIGVADRVSVEV